jgi:hypothetical protein
MQHVVKQEGHVNENRTYANPDKYDDDTDATKGRCFGYYLHIDKFRVVGR